MKATQGKTSKAMTVQTKCERNPDDNGSNYVAYICKRPNQGQKRWEQRGQSIVSIDPQKSPQLFVFTPHRLSRREKKTCFQQFYEAVSKMGLTP